jgi:hypothetical protein
MLTPSALKHGFGDLIPRGESSQGGGLKGLWKIAGEAKATQLDRQGQVTRRANAFMPFLGHREARAGGCSHRRTYATMTGTHSNKTATKHERGARFTFVDLSVSCLTVILL